MTDGDMWGQDEAGVDAFSLPGDERIEQQLAGQQTAVAEPETVEPAESAESKEPAESEERARDEHGRFAKKDEEAPAEEAAEEVEVEETAAEQAERLIAGQYKTVEEAERALLEKQALIERQGNELGEWRQYVQQMQAAQQRQAQAPADWEALIDENPAQAAQLAYQQQNPHAYRAAMEAWEDVSPGTPSVWLQNMQLQAQAAETAQHQQQQQWNESLAQFARENPGIDAIPTEELLAAGQNNPAFLEMIQKSTNPEARLGALRVLYLEAEQARGRKSETLVTAAQDIARVQAEATREAKAEAILSSANANLDGGPKKTGAELVGDQWRSMEQHLHDGWNP